MICVDPALKYPNVELITNAQVMKLQTSASGRDVTHVNFTREGVPEEYSADLVVVSCGAINSAALLLRSANGRHPNGLANGSDVVGRHYMGHVNSVVMAISPERNDSVFQKTLALNDFYFANETWQYPMGHISFVGKLDADTLSAGAPPRLLFVGSGAIGMVPLLGLTVGSLGTGVGDWIALPAAKRPLKLLRAWLVPRGADVASFPPKA